ncbi:hypothetical protein UFOVP250_103 [uncultured Caudovirales phage]|uniref:Uncharacterized protein n=1 Tax=uncultured Caudovirales phage TaxID=2100421 RepID=A0A6J5LGE7_9CAUD|nr:hypothetical protein UFOVP250_103 [uncultured Caudovirales phage]
MKISKKSTAALVELMNNMALARSMTTRHVMKEEVDHDMLSFWMRDFDEQVMALRALLGVEVTETYAEIKERYSN